MSFNRGAKRNSFGRRNFNRSGGNNSGGENLSDQKNMGGNLMGRLDGPGSGAGGGGVNPWEGGMMPGRGLLPTPNNNLSLNSSQAQLVIASNLLTNLLRTQELPQLPSLLSLGNNMNNPDRNFGNQQNFGAGRFNNRPVRNHPMKNQRPQPYNKMGNRARDGVAGRRGQSAQQSRAPQSANQRSNGSQNQHRNDKSSKANPASKQNQSGKKEQQEVKSSDKEKAETHVAKSDESEETEEKKRDWKDEKKVGEAEESENKETPPPEEQPKEAVSENAEKPAAAEKKTEDAQAGGGGKKSATRHAESRYAAVPMSQMFCHVCNKHMWDGFSFENHLRGRAHQLMMEKLDESYKLQVDLMRHELRVAEEQRELSLTNSKRRGKKVSVDLNVREYCTMCDLNFFGTLSSHRKSEKHQQLKTFLHPRCFPCMKEFPSRIEYDEHCLTPAHMKSNAQNEEQGKNKKKDKLAKGESEVRSAEDEEKDVGPETKANDKEEELPENTEYVTDFVDNLSNLSNYRVPSFKHCRQNQISVGKSMIKEVQGWHCEKCRRFMLNEADMAAHIRSFTHYRNFSQEFKAQAAAAAEAAAKSAAPTEEKTKTELDIKEEAKEDDNDNYEGDWKRRKVDHPNENDESMNDDEKKAVSEESTASKKNDGEEKYDPLEADADSADDTENHDKTENAAANNVHDENSETGTPVEKMWADIDNDNDLEVGNLIDDDTDKKDIEDVKMQTEPEKKVEVSTPEVSEHPPGSQIKSPAVGNTSINNSSVVNTPQSKSPRGRGYGRGRGSQRARRSRR